MAEEEPKKYPYCFGCGEANPIGLRLEYRRVDDQLVTEFVPQEVHQGWPGIVHGGIITSLLYEVMENFPCYRGSTAMMRGIETNLRRPAHTGSTIVAMSWLVEQSGREWRVAASLKGEDRKLIAEGKASLVVLNQAQQERIGISDEGA